MTTEPISDQKLDELLDLAAKAPPYDRRGLIDAIVAETGQNSAAAGKEEDFVLFALTRRPVLTSGIAMSVAALGIVSGVMTEILYGDYLAAALMIDGITNATASTLLTGGWI